MTIVIGITGGIGAGKSTFSKQVLRRGYGLFDSDKCVSKIYKKPTKQFLNILNIIGLKKSMNNNINKKLISKIIFSNKMAKKKLENYIFKIVRKKRSNFIKNEIKKNRKVVFVDIPLLFENKLKNDFDIIISIVSSKKNRLERLQKSKKLSTEMFNKIIKSQTTDVFRKRNSDIVIFNNSTMEKYLKKINSTLDTIIL